MATTLAPTKRRILVKGLTFSNGEEMGKHFNVNATTALNWVKKGKTPEGDIIRTIKIVK